MFPALFLDCNLDSRLLIAALEAREISFGRLALTHPIGTLDVDWIPDVAAQKSVILTRDRHIITRSLESQVVRRAGAAMVVLIGGEMTGVEITGAIMLHIPRILDWGQNQARPFIVKIYRDGSHQFVALEN